jgi:hypothetical protein
MWRGTEGRRSRGAGSTMAPSFAFVAQSPPARRGALAVGCRVGAVESINLGDGCPVVGLLLGQGGWGGAEPISDRSFSRVGQVPPVVRFLLLERERLAYHLAKGNNAPNRLQC